MAYYRNNNASSHIFTGLGDAPWRFLGLHASKVPNPPQRTRLDMEALKGSSFMYTVMCRDKKGEMMGNNGVAFRGDYKSYNSFLGFVFSGKSDRVDITRVRELIVKKVDLGCKDSDWGRTPQIKVGAQELVLHLAFKDMKEIPAETPFVVVHRGNNRHIIGIGELVGFNLENVDNKGYGDRVPYTNPNKDAIVAHLGKMQAKRTAWLEQKAKTAEMEKEMGDDENKVTHPLDELNRTDDDDDGSNPLS